MCSLHPFEITLTFLQYLWLIKKQAPPPFFLPVLIGSLSLRKNTKALWCYKGIRMVLSNVTVQKITRHILDHREIEHSHIM